MWRPPAIRVPDRVDVLVTMDPAGPAVGVAKGDLRPVGHAQGLPGYYGTQATLQACLEIGQ